MKSQSKKVGNEPLRLACKAHKGYGYQDDCVWCWKMDGYRKKHKLAKKGKSRGKKA